MSQNFLQQDFPIFRNQSVPAAARIALQAIKGGKYISQKSSEAEISDQTWKEALRNLHSSGNWEAKPWLLQSTAFSGTVLRLGVFRLNFRKTGLSKTANQIKKSTQSLWLKWRNSKHFVFWRLQNPNFTMHMMQKGMLPKEDEAIFDPVWLYNIMFFLRLKESTTGNISHKTEGMVLPQEFRITWFVLGKTIGFQTCTQARGRVKT